MKDRGEKLDSSSEITAHAILYLREFPEVIHVPHPCVAIADISNVFSLLAPTTPVDQVHAIQDELLHIQRQYIHPEFNFMVAEASMLNNVVTNLAQERAARDPSCGVVNMDRHICSNIEGLQYFRLNVSRGEHGGIVARPGALETPEVQLQNLVRWAQRHGYKKLVLVDDVLAYGDTLIPLLTQIQQSLPNISLEVLVGLASTQGKWSGIEKVEANTNASVTSVTTIVASPENEWSTGMTIPVSKDMTIFGGKVSHQNEIPVIHPYFLPFSKPKKASLASDIQGGERSFRLLEFSIKMIELIDANRDQPLTVGDLVKNHIGVPATSLTSLVGIMEIPKADVCVMQYLLYCRDVLKNNIESILAEISQ